MNIQEQLTNHERTPYVQSDDSDFNRGFHEYCLEGCKVMLSLPKCFLALSITTRQERDSAVRFETSK